MIMESDLIQPLLTPDCIGFSLCIGFNKIHLLHRLIYLWLLSFDISLLKLEGREEF